MLKLVLRIEYWTGSYEVSGATFWSQIKFGLLILIIHWISRPPGLWCNCIMGVPKSSQPNLERIPKIILIFDQIFTKWIKLTTFQHPLIYYKVRWFIIKSWIVLLTIYDLEFIFSCLPTKFGSYTIHMYKIQSIHPYCV